MKTELEIFSTRYSCRNFKNEKLKKEDLDTILEIARLSPSSLGLEPWRFLVVQDDNKKEESSPNLQSTTTCKRLRGVNYHCFKA